MKPGLVASILGVLTLATPVGSAEGDEACLVYGGSFVEDGSYPSVLMTRPPAGFYVDYWSGQIELWVYGPDPNPTKHQEHVFYVVC